MGKAFQCIHSENGWFYEATVTGIGLTEDAPGKSGSPGAPVELETGPDEKRF